MQPKSSSNLPLPVLPLRSQVLLPGVTVSIQVGRAESLKALETAGATEGPTRLLALTQAHDTVEVEPGGLGTVGVLLEVLHREQSPLGLQLVCKALERIEALGVSRNEGGLESRYRVLPDLPLQAPEAPETVALLREFEEQAEAFASRRGVPPQVRRALRSEAASPGRFADAVGYYLSNDSGELQDLLQDLDVETRIRTVLRWLHADVGVSEAQEALRASVQEEIGKGQKEAYLREQMKAIRRELGDEDKTSEVDRLSAKLEALSLGDEAKEEVARALKRISRLPRESSEGQLLWTWLETVAGLPWDARSEEVLDVAKAREVLDRDHYGLPDVKRRVLEFLAVRKLSARGHEASSGPILLFSGPPGTGKTSVAESIAGALGRKYARVALGGARDEADIRGHRRTYVGALPGRILKAIQRAGTRNPVLCLDEIDKLGAGYQGDPAAALLEVLDPAQNKAFVDHYLGVPFDLSEVLFVCTANYLERIPPALRDRLEAIPFSGYTAGEKVEIAKQHLLPRLTEKVGLDAGSLVLADQVLQEVVTRWTREAGVRQLTQVLGKLTRRAALELVEAEEADAPLETRSAGLQPGSDDLHRLLGRPKVRPEHRLEEDVVGVATGMYYTPAGGDIMFLEVGVLPGAEGLILTGQLGDVMKESARAAWSYVRSQAARFGISSDELRNREVHIHVPAGAVPKDGPSAGVALAVALVSALTGRPVRSQVAMTGEVTLRGKVLPIGGVKEKLLGAARAGITRVLLPGANQADLEDVPQEILEGLEVRFVDDLTEVFPLVLAPTISAQAA